MPAEEGAGVGSLDSSRIFVLHALTSMKFHVSKVVCADDPLRFQHAGPDSSLTYHMEGKKELERILKRWKTQRKPGDECQGGTPDHQT